MIDPSLFAPGGPLAALAPNGQLDPVLVAQLLSKQPQLNQVDKDGGMLIQPDPGFVVKTAEVSGSSKSKGFKTFINVCCSKHIDKMHERSIAEGEAMGGEQGLRIPLSIGETREDFDKSGEPCSSVDVIINDETLQQAEADANLKSIVGEFVVMAVGQKHKKTFNGFTFPKMKYKGTLPPLVQRIRASKLSQIEEVSTEPQDDAPLPRAVRDILGGQRPQIVMGSQDGHVPLQTPQQPTPTAAQPSSSASAPSAPKAAPKILPNLSVVYWRPKAKNPMLAHMILPDDDDEDEQEGDHQTDEGNKDDHDATSSLFPPQMGSKLDATELPLFPPAELAVDSAAARKSGLKGAFNFAKAVKGSERSEADRKRMQEEWEEQRAAALLSIQGCTWRAVVPMPSLRPAGVKLPEEAVTALGDAAAQFTLAISESGLTVQWNRRPQLAGLTLPSGAPVRNPAYSPLSVAFPYPFSEEAINQARAWWDEKTLTLTVDVPVPPQD